MNVSILFLITHTHTQKKKTNQVLKKKNNFNERVGIGDRIERTAGGAPKD